MSGTERNASTVEAPDEQQRSERDRHLAGQPGGSPAAVELLERS